MAQNMFQSMKQYEHLCSFDEKSEIEEHHENLQDSI